MPSFALSRRAFCLGAATTLGAVSAPAAEEGFEPLFNGEDLTGWEGDDLLWVVEDGALIGRSPGIGYNDFLAATERYGDFILRYKVHLVNNIGNSGVQFRSERVKGSMEMSGYQADVGPGWWGDLYDESRRRVTLADADEKLIGRILKPDDFNDYEIHAEGKRIVLRINGKVTADYTEPEDGIAESGLIAVQIHSSREPLEVRFRDMRIKTL